MEEVMARWIGMSLDDRNAPGHAALREEGL
jgi:hypothetical protein